MKIPIDRIRLDPDSTWEEVRSGKRAPVSKKIDPPAIIVRPIPGDRGAFMLVCGLTRLRRVKAELAGKDGEVECELAETLTPSELSEMQVVDRYTGRAPALEKARAFMRHREDYDVTQQELGRRTGITPGSIHHYESLIRALDPRLREHLNEGRLVLKEARSLADVADFERQVELAEPFFSGRLSSVYVERLVSLAKSKPHLSIEQIVEEVVHGSKAPAPEPVGESEAPGPTSAEGIMQMALDLAAKLDPEAIAKIPEYQRMKLAGPLRILGDHIAGVQEVLPARAVAEPEPERAPELAEMAV